MAAQLRGTCLILLPIDAFWANTEYVIVTTVYAIVPVCLLCLSLCLSVYYTFCVHAAYHIIECFCLLL